MSAVRSQWGKIPQQVARLDREAQRHGYRVVSKEAFESFLRDARVAEEWHPIIDGLERRLAKMTRRAVWARGEVDRLMAELETERARSWWNRLRHGRSG